MSYKKKEKKKKKREMVVTPRRRRSSGVDSVAEELRARGSAGRTRAAEGVCRDR